jgi:hypothetical protein
VAALSSDGIAAARHANVVPPQLVAKWSRTITKADVQRSSGGLVLMAGHVATLRIAKSGRWTVVIAGLGGLGTADGTVVTAGNHLVRLNVTGEPPNLYKWSVSATRLTLTKLKDSVPDRRLVFAGVWTQK